jgi:hypothetical protein
MAKKQSPPEAFDLGDSAEGCFDIWLRDEGVVASPPRKDKGGWDFYVDLPSTPGVASDPVPVKLNCSVQVKGQLVTTKQPPPIKLSNWKRMVEEPTPWFVLVLLYTGKRPARAALIHIGKEWIDRVMERIWRNRAGKNTDLHRLSMRAQWNPEEELPAIHDGTGKDIVDAIRAHIGDPSAYVKRKMQQLKNAGVGRAKHTVTFRTRNDHVDFEKLVAVALGDTQDIPVVDVVTADVRFGIPIPRDTSEGGTISFQPRPHRERARANFVTLTPVREPFSMEFDIYASASVFPFLPEEYRRIRLVAPLLKCDITPRLDNTPATFRWQMQIEEGSVQLHKLVQAARALSALIQPNAPECEIEFPRGKLTLPGGGSGTMSSDPGVLEIIEAVSAADYVARAFGLRLDEVDVDPRELQDERADLGVLASLFMGTMPSSTLTVTGVTSDANGIQVGHATVSGARIGDRMLLACIALVGEAAWKPDDGGTITVVPSIRVTERCIVSRDESEREDFHRRVVRPMITRTERALEEEGMRLVGHETRDED